jgi:hypothetical protein
MFMVRLRASLAKTLWSFFRLLPIIIGMLLLTSLVVSLLPRHVPAGLFGDHQLLDALLGAGLGSVAAGHPLASYLLGGELLKGGVSLVAVTALLVSWVTVGVVQLPAEALLLGMRFAVYRNLLCFFSAVALAFFMAYALPLFG